MNLSLIQSPFPRISEPEKMSYKQYLAIQMAYSEEDEMEIMSHLTAESLDRNIFEDIDDGAEHFLHQIKKYP